MPYNTTITLSRSCPSILQNVGKLHGLPRSIVPIVSSVRSRIYRELLGSLASRVTTTAYTLRQNGQTERVTGARTVSPVLSMSVRTTGMTPTMAEFQYNITFTRNPARPVLPGLRSHPRMGFGLAQPASDGNINEFTDQDALRIDRGQGCTGEAQEEHDSLLHTNVEKPALSMPPGDKVYRGSDFGLRPSRSYTRFLGPYVGTSCQT